MASLLSPPPTSIDFAWPARFQACFFPLFRSWAGFLGLPFRRLMLSSPSHVGSGNGRDPSPPRPWCFQILFWSFPGSRCKFLCVSPFWMAIVNQLAKHLLFCVPWRPSPQNPLPLPLMLFFWRVLFCARGRINRWRCS